MDKDASVNDIVQRLRSDLAQAFDVVDHWPDDPHAVGVAQPSDHRFLVYFCTFPPETETIAYERESPSSDEDLPYSTDGMVESASGIGHLCRSSYGLPTAPRRLSDLRG